jgi:hypothetical protein
MRRPLLIRDKPTRLNLANFERRLRKLRMVFAIILEEIDDGLKQVEADRNSRDESGRNENGQDRPS